MGCHHIGQDVYNVHVATLAPRRKWRTLASIQRDRNDQQHLPRLHFTRKLPRCHAVQSAATQSQEAALRQQTDQGVPAHPDAHFQGLSWLGEQESQLATETHQEEQDQRLQGAQPAKPRKIKHIDEDQRVRHKFHRRMMQAASQGQASDVSEILEEMQEDGLEPGPYAYHALVFAHVKRKDPSAALEVMGLMDKLDLQPVPQSYCAVILSFVRDDQPEAALAVFESMERSSISAYIGWLTITNQLFAAGYRDMAEKCVRDRQPSWQPDADLYENIIKSTCSADPSRSAVYTANTSDPDPPADSPDNDGPQLRAANAILAEMKARAITQEARHLHPILEVRANNGSSSEVEHTVQEMSYGRRAAPNARTFEILARAHIQSGKDGLVEQLTSTSTLLAKAGLQPSNRFQMLLAEGHLLANDLEEVLQLFQSLRTSGRIRGVMLLLPDAVLLSLLQKLSAASMPAELLRMLKAMNLDGRPMPAVEHSTASNTGRSLLTSWLAGPRTRAMKGFEGVLTQSKEAEGDVIDVEGVSILRGNAITAEGKVISVSNMKANQLRAELTARKLSTEGNQKDLMRRVRAARKAELPDMAAAIRKKEAQRDAKRSKLEKAMKEEVAASKAGEPHPAGSSEHGKAVLKVVSYGTGQLTVQDSNQFDVEIEDEEEGVIGDDEATQDTAVDPMQAPKVATANDDDEEYVVGDADSLEDMLDESDDIINDLPATRGNGAAVRQQAAVAAASHSSVSNADAGADVAMQILHICRVLGGSATAADYEQILQVSEAEGNAIVARNLVRSWHSVLLSACDNPSDVGHMYNRAARVCVDSNNLLLAKEVLADMQSRKVEIDSQLREDIESVEESDSDDE